MGGAMGIGRGCDGQGNGLGRNGGESIPDPRSGREGWGNQASYALAPPKEVAKVGNMGEGQWAGGII